MIAARVTYAWVWPGRPGGYVPVLADQFLAEKARREKYTSLKATRDRQAKARKPVARRAK